MRDPAPGGMRSFNRFGYATDRTAETWDDIPGETREEAAANALAEVEDAPVVYVCLAKPVDKIAPLLYALDADLVLERAEEAREATETATWWEDELFDISMAARQDLDARLAEAARAWLLAFPGRRVWEVTEVTRHARD